MYKRILWLSVSLIIVMVTTTWSQEQATEPGSWLLGGSVSYSSVGGDELDDRVNTLMVAPSAVWFFAPCFGVGVQTEVARVTQGDAVDVHHAYIGKALYVFPTGASVRPVVGAGGGFIRLSTNDQDQDESVNGYTMRFAGGIFLFLNEHYALSAELNYDYSKLMISEDNDPATNQFVFAVGFSGFVY